MSICMTCKKSRRFYVTIGRSASIYLLIGLLDSEYSLKDLSPDPEFIMSMHYACIQGE
jgi:hypothetical protein